MLKPSEKQYRNETQEKGSIMALIRALATHQDLDRPCGHSLTMIIRGHNVAQFQGDTNETGEKTSSE